MAEMDLVTRVRDAADRRHVTARLTAKGGRLLAEATPPLEALARQRFERLPEAALDQLVDALAAVRAPL
jgi:DNA-binding MarR family transcriptional regulator